MNEYKKVRLGDVATYINGYAFKPTDWTEKGLPIIRIQDLTGNDYETNHCDKEIDKKYYIKNGDVLISWSASLGIYEWLKGDALLNQHIFKVVFDKLDVDKKYFMYEIKSLLSEMSKNTHGSTMHHITKPVFDNMPFYIPPIETQKQIAATLDKVTKIISENKKLLEKYDLLIKSRFIEMFGDPLKNPRKWETKKISEICNLNRYPTFYGFEYSTKGIPVIKIGNIGTDNKVTFNNSDYDYITNEINDRYPDTKIEALDIVMAVRGDGSTAKRIGIIEDERLYNANISPNLIIFRIKNYLDPYFLLHLLISEGGQIKLDKYVTKTAKKTITATDIYKIELYVPPLELQQQFANFVQQIDKSKFVVQKSLEKAETLYKSLMQEYFE